MDIEEVCRLGAILDLQGIDFWIDGGWGVDAPLGHQTRPHSDLDLAVYLLDFEKLNEVLEREGYARVADPEARYWNPVYQNLAGKSVDLHGFVLDSEGKGVLGDPADEAFYPAGALDGVGQIGNIQVRCIAAPIVLMFRNGFEPRAVDRHDVAVLCDTFDLPRPSRFRPT